MNYNDAEQKLGKRESRKLENNTYLQRRDSETIAVRLHGTDIVTFKANGDTVLNSGGWRTVTTKARLNSYAPVQVWSVRGVWFVGRELPNLKLMRCKTIPFEDGMVIQP